ncbi:5712_t:CDS:2 [Ambispora gerdemannii]|uniref:5712_t:CDS:1 n=1 Tax=Ambispora gerdemannii TaxID=144530 RepID=A0A9N9FBE1_9GLOM|nr:5712_t:CDS:2 [Ambispora gerdemannii]
MSTKNNNDKSPHASPTNPMPFPMDFDLIAIQQSINNYLIPYFHTTCEFLVLHYRLHTPDWLQTRGDVIHEFLRGHQLLSDYLLSFAFWYSLPLLWFLVWSVGGFLITAFIGVTMFVVTNGFIIGSASLVITPFFIFAIMASFMTTFAISVGRVAMRLRQATKTIDVNNPSGFFGISNQEIEILKEELNEKVYKEVLNEDEQQKYLEMNDLKNFAENALKKLEYLLAENNYLRQNLEI